ncbi:hypothetical protein PGIGA_G00239970 [Pangasianodon gigas]|uniref:Uncharacterized protein n=1 Tax=Pangasianodon gigas TaxID=30993 RepID=A0ACC5WMY7_PANGG|nr:hypothetical protein [Pangasianodon gigas]
MTLLVFLLAEAVSAGGDGERCGVSAILRFLWKIKNKSGKNFIMSMTTFQKITSRGKTSKSPESRFPAARSENMKRKITDFELSQLQERLKETEEVMERIVSRARAQSGNTPREECVSVDQEEKLLLQLREITRVMQEGRLVDGIPSETETLDPEFTDRQTGEEETERADRQTDEETERADRQTDEEETEQADRQTDEETERADRQTDEETERADRQTGEEETERADRQTDEEETERADRQTDEEETERADRQTDEEETERADRQADGCERKECSEAGGDEEEEMCTEVMKLSEDQRWNTSPSGGREIRRRSGRGTTRGTESSH